METFRLVFFLILLSPIMIAILYLEDDAYQATWVFSLLLNNLALALPSRNYLLIESLVSQKLVDPMDFVYITE